MSEARKLTDHDEIRRWAEERGGHPSVVAVSETGGGGAGALRLDFGSPEERLEEISWETFFETFDAKKLALLVQEETAGGDTSRFFKFVDR